MLHLLGCSWLPVTFVVFIIIQRTKCRLLQKNVIGQIIMPWTDIVSQVGESGKPPSLGKYSWGGTQSGKCLPEFIEILRPDFTFVALRLGQESRWWQDALLQSLEKESERILEGNLVKDNWGDLFSSEVMTGILWEHFGEMALEIQSRHLNFSQMKVLWADLVHMWFPWFIENSNKVWGKNWVKPQCPAEQMRPTRSVF